MRTRLTSYALAGALGLTGVAGAVLIAPAVSYAATGDSTALDDRVSAIKDALTGLVSDGTITQDQADAVATTLAEARQGGPGGHGGHGGHGGRGMHLSDALEPLGITQEELRAAAEAGTTLAELAEQNGVGTDAVVDALVAAKEQHLEQAVADGRLTQEQADEKLAEAEARITERLDDPLRPHRGGHGRHGGPPAPQQEPATQDGTA